MRVRIKRKNLSRLASLSALGAGAMALGAGTAEADIVEVNVNQTVIPASNILSFGTVAAAKVSLPGGAALTLQPFSNWTLHAGIIGGAFTSRGYSTFFKILARVNQFQRIQLLGSGLSGPFSRLGRKGVPAFGPVGTITVASRFSAKTTRSYNTRPGFRRNVSSVTRFGNRTYAHASNFFADPYRYFLFHFSDNGKTLYGWGQLDVTVGNTVGPDVTFVDYAYDTTGARIAPGQTSPVPEPAETIPLALSALVLGAAGVRRWRGEAQKLKS